MITKQMEEDFLNLIKKYPGKWKLNDFEEIIFRERDLDEIFFDFNGNSDFNPYLFDSESDILLERKFEEAYKVKKGGLKTLYL